MTNDRHDAHCIGDVETLRRRVEELEAQNAELHRQLMQAQRLSSVGALAASVTHEFNNILTTTINYARMGLRHKDQPTRDKAFDKILSAGQRASRITTGMLAFARGNGDRREPLELEPLVREVLVLAEKDLQMHRVRWQFDVVGKPVAEVNAIQIQQVLLNLIVNARQAMAGGGELRITIRENQETQTAEITLRDTGPGIPPESLHRIFEPFYSTKERDQTGRGGTGLGLALCRDIMETHRGRIRVESTVGVGTAFTLKFPSASQSAPLAAAG
jgi:signal transduction histidine kinase